MHYSRCCGEETTKDINQAHPLMPAMNILKTPNAPESALATLVSCSPQISN
jgi:hypothetical protein